MHRLLILGIVLASTAVALAIAEVAVRAGGHAPWVSRGAGTEAVMYEPDPVLGWHPIPGRRWYGPYAAGGHRTVVTVHADGGRETGAGRGDERPEILLVGDSYTMGKAVSDDETFAAGLQRLRPDLRVVNQGVIGYGTFQSLLLLEQLLRNGARPARAIYGYVFIHEVRNVADPSWLRTLAVHSGHGMVSVPYGTLDAADDLVRHPPRPYPHWPLRDRLATITLLQDFFANVRPPSTMTSFLVTLRSMEAMAHACQNYGVPFSVMVLTEFGEPWRYRRELEQRGIDIIDCHLQIGPELAVPGEGHPNPVAHGRWAACLDQALATRLPRGALQAEKAG